MNAWESRHDEDGVILVISAIVLIIFIGMAAFVVDLTLKSQSRQFLWNTADSAALAGASQLPDDPAGAAALAFQYALENDPELAGDLVATYRCLVADANGDGQPDPLEVPAKCNPGADFGMTAPPWVCADGQCSAVCDPGEGDTCNTIVMEVKKTVEYAFAPAVGVFEGETGVLSAACRGLCASPLTGPLDLMVIIDRTTSMRTPPDALPNAKSAVLALLDYLNPSQQSVGLAAINAGNLSNGACSDVGGSNWVLVGLSDDYKDTLNYDFDLDGTNDLDSTSSLVSTTRCLDYITGTDLGNPVRAAANYLTTGGRPGVKKAIILLSDGQAVKPDAQPNHCQYAEDMAAVAKAQGVEMFTIGFGIAGKDCEDASGAYVSGGDSVSQLLARMASGGAGDQCSNPAVENSDGDNFFCAPKSSDLSSVFIAAASQLSSGSALVQLPG
ncbi:MAG: VWA domain-containing protein [Acidimicrobiia bacterium]|nr:VWA domain-containing protein [Acidimicrobiia bacterium]